MTYDELVDLGMVLAAVRGLTDEVKALRGEVKLLRTATDTAFGEAQRVNKLVHKLACMEPDTDPECPVALSDAPPRRDTLSDLDEYSSVTAAAVQAATRAAIDEVRRHRSTRPLAIVGPFGLQIKGGAAVVIAVAVLATLGYVVAPHLGWLR